MDTNPVSEEISKNYIWPGGCPPASRRTEKKSTNSNVPPNQDETWFWGLGNHTQHIKEQLRLASDHDGNVLIIGETGTGKEWIAQRIHGLRRRRLACSEIESPFVSINAGAIPDTLLESILFGHERGAFTSARERQLGKFELARRGCLFLDEIQTLPIHCQIKLLRVLESKKVERLGAKEGIQLQCQILAASNIPLEILLREGKFRKDLYFRLNVFPIYIPALRHRREDIPSLAEALLQRVRRDLRLGPRRFSEEALQTLQTYAWPGNIRELEHALQYAALRSEEQIEKLDLPWTLTGNLVKYLEIGDWKI